MRENVLYAVVTLLACAVVTLFPWLSFQEAKKQALDAESRLALAYARDVRHRADELGRQAESVINRIARLGYVPCSNEARALLYEIDLTSTYLQAIGYVRNGMLVCSSLGDLPTPLGTTFFQTSNGARLYLDVPLGRQTRSALIAIEQNGIAVIAHRDLPLDTWMERSGVSVAVVHLERPKNARPTIARGHIDSNWVGRLGSKGETTFVDRGYVVAIVRSLRIPSVAIAALPLSDVDARTNQIAARLVPAGFVTGLLVAGMLLLLTRRQLSVASALRYALRHNEFFLRYQPLIDLATGRYVGVEALLRMRRRTGELIGPDLFIPIAEETGLITRLTERVIELIEQDTGNFLALHPDFHIAINISSDDLQSEKLLDAIDRFLERSGATPSNLIVEITERLY
jgi:sensor c-di-GMP phosphodiesterase-like protein